MAISFFKMGRYMQTNSVDCSLPCELSGHTVDLRGHKIKFSLSASLWTVLKGLLSGAVGCDCTLAQHETYN